MPQTATLLECNRIAQPADLFEEPNLGVNCTLRISDVCLSQVSARLSPEDWVLQP